jgi:hypothetical protein
MIAFIPQKLFHNFKKISMSLFLVVNLFWGSNCELFDTCGDAVCGESEDYTTCLADCPGPVGDWHYASDYTSTAVGACQWLDPFEYADMDTCFTNITEGACAYLPLESGYGGIMKFSTSEGSTSLDPNNNICLYNGYSDCVYYTNGFVYCGPNDIAAMSEGNFPELIRKLNEDILLQRSR